MPTPSKQSGIVLIHPPAVSKRYLRTKFMPYGMAVVYSFLKEHDVPVVQYDFLMEYLFDAPEDIDFHNPEKTFSEEEFFSFLNGDQSHQGLESFSVKYGNRLPQDPLIYGFSIVAYHQFWASLLLAKLIRSRSPGSAIVFGGPYVTIKPTESLALYGQADYWIKGSGEIPLLRLSQLLLGKTGVSEDDIPGLSFVRNGSLHQSPQSRMPAEDERPPDFEGLTLDSYRYDHPETGPQTLFLPYRLSKGCPSRCSFCTGRLVDSYDSKSPGKVVREVMDLARIYDTVTFQFADASINGDPSKLADICQKFSRLFPDMKWYSYAKVNGFTTELLSQARRAGCFSLFWGIESASQPTIQLLGKRFKVEEMYELLDHGNAVGITNYIHLMYNTPHESKDDVEAFIRLVDRYINSPRVVFLPQRFLLESQSLLFEQPERYGLSGVRKVQGSVFEREQYVYQESTGLDQSAIMERNELHRKLLFEHLDLIKYRNMMRESRHRLSRFLSPKLLVRSGKYSNKWQLMQKIHNKVVALIQDGSNSMREQL